MCKKMKKRRGVGNKNAKIKAKGMTFIFALLYY